MSHRVNITRIKAVSNALANLKNDIVFVGGATVSLYATRPAVETRPTDDVDIAVELATYRHFTEFENQLRKLGFQNDPDGHIGRFLIDGLVLDVIPTSQTELGFFNIWYEERFQKAIEYVIDPQHTVKIFKAPYFLASKFEAIKGRKPKEDLRLSKDLEEIIFVLENRPVVWDEMLNAQDKVKSYLLSEFNALYNNPYLEEIIGGHTGINAASSVYYIIEEMEKFIS